VLSLCCIMQGDLNDDQIKAYFSQFGEITDAVVS
jgi:hypothetical protein